MLKRPLSSAVDSIFGFVLGVAAVACSADPASEAQNPAEPVPVEISAIPEEWPDNVLQPEGLSDIGGEMTAWEQTTNINLWGTIARPAGSSKTDLKNEQGRAYVLAYMKTLEAAEFKQRDFSDRRDEVHTSYFRDNVTIHIGTSLTNRRTAKEYIEVGVNMYFPTK